MGLKDTLRKGKIMAGSVLAAGLMMGASAPAQENNAQSSDKPASVQRNTYPNKTAQELEARASKRVQRKGKEYEVTQKTEEGYFVYDSETRVYKNYYPDGKLQSFFDTNSGKTVGYYPDGIRKSHECDGFDAPFYEYYPNGQLKATPVPQPRNLYNYEVFSEDGKVIASHESQSRFEKRFSSTESNELFESDYESHSFLNTTSRWTLYNSKTGKKTAGYTAEDTAAQGGGLLKEIRFYDENGKKQKIPLNILRIRLKIREDGALRPLSEKFLRQIAQKEQMKKLALAMGSSR